MKVTRRTWRGTKGGRNVQRPICTAISSGKYHLKRKGSGANCDNLIQLIDQSGTANLETFIATIATARNDSKSRTLTLNLTNLLRINKTPVDSEEKNWSFTLLNPRSVKNKTLSINDFILDSNIDLLALTETWLGTNNDKTVLSELTPNTHKIHCVSRQGQGEVEPLLCITQTSTSTWSSHRPILHTLNCSSVPSAPKTTILDSVLSTDHLRLELISSKFYLLRRVVGFLGLRCCYT